MIRHLLALIAPPSMPQPATPTVRLRLPTPPTREPLGTELDLEHDDQAEAAELPPVPPEFLVDLALTEDQIRTYLHARACL